MGDNPIKDEVENFNRRSLKKTKTEEKQYMPTKEDMDQAKKEEEVKEEKK